MRGIILLILFCTGVTALGQPSNNIHGKVTDSTDKHPLAFVTVTLVEQLTGKMQYNFSDSTGAYSFASINPGTYHLVFSFVGYDSSKSQEFEVRDTSAITIPTISLSRTAVTLKAVTVSALKPLVEMKADGLLYNATSETQLAGTNTLDLLRKVPLLIVDPNGSISVAGSGSTKIFIDGKPSTLYGNSVSDYLTLLPADRIEKVQVITNPSAKYDAEGAERVILIFTKKNRLRNLTGTIRTMGAAGDYRNTLQNGFSLFYKAKKIAFSGGGSYTSSKRIQENVVERIAVDKSSGLTQQVFDTMRRTSPTFNVNMDMELDSMSSLNINGTYVRWKSKDYMLQDNNLQEGNLSRYYTRNIFQITDNTGYTASLAYSKRFRQEGREFSFLGFYNKRNREERYNLLQSENNRTNYREDYQNLANSREWSMQADYSQPIMNNNKQTGKWETGVKVSQLNAQSDYVVTPFDENRSGSFSYKQNVYAAYLSHETSLGKWQLRTGLRYEQTALTAFFKQDKVMIEPYKNLVPNIAVSRSFKNQDMISFSYTQGISRPFMSALNPAINYSDSLNISKGNPALKPAINHRIESAYTFKLPKDAFLRVSVFGTKTNNSLVQATRLLTNGVALTSWENSGLDQSIGISTSWNQPVTKQLKITFNVNTNWREVRIPASGLGNSGWSAFSSFYFTYAMGKGYNMEGFIMSQTSRIEIQGKSSVIFPQYYLLAFGKKLWNNKAGISFRMDSFLTPQQPFTSEYHYPDFTQKNIYYLSNRVFQIAFNWRFNQQLTETRSRAAGKAQSVSTE